MSENQAGSVPLQTEEWRPFSVPESARTEATLERGAAGSVRRRGWLLRRLLLGADLFGLTAAFAITEFVFPLGPGHSGLIGRGTEIALFLGTLPLWVLVTRVYGLYHRDDSQLTHTTVDEVIHIFHMVTVCSWLLFGGAWISRLAHPAVPKLMLFWALATCTVPLGRSAVRVWARGRPSFLQNAVIIGAGKVAQGLAEKFMRHPESGVNVVGFLERKPREPRLGLRHIAVLGAPEDLPWVIEAYDVERVIVAFSRESDRDVLDLIREISDPWMQVDIVPRYFDLISTGTSLSSIEGLPVLGLAPRALSASSQGAKRAMDLILGALLVLAASPLLAAIAIAVKLGSPGPVFFRQQRIGAGGEPFSIFKFRTMADGADLEKDLVAHLNRHAARSSDARMFKAASDPRVTGIGRILRRLSFDELPQLFNVISGDMSLVGPRPLIPEEAVHVDAWARTRMSLKPGMTGLWQILGRSDIPFDEMVRLDYLYVTNWSLWNDLKLILRTLPVLAGAGRGAY